MAAVSALNSNTFRLPSFRPNDHILSAALALALLSASGAASAVAIHPDLSIAGTTAIDTGVSDGATAGNLNGTAGGAASAVAYLGAPYPAQQSYTLTETGDRIGFDGSVDISDAEYFTGIDSSVTLTNSSATTSYNIFFDWLVDNSVDADGADAYSDSEISLLLDGLELSFSDLVSDTVFGDQIAAIETGGFGDPQSESFIHSFMVTLTPGLSAVLDLNWTLAGGDFDSGRAFASLDTYLEVTNFEAIGTPPAQIPVPATAWLMALGLLGMLSRARRVANR